MTANHCLVGVSKSEVLRGELSLCRLDIHEKSCGFKLIFGEVLRLPIEMGHALAQLGLGTPRIMKCARTMCF